jgi:hypothetical protein
MLCPAQTIRLVAAGVLHLALAVVLIALHVRREATVVLFLLAATLPRPATGPRG